MQFQDLHIIDPILKSLEEEGYSIPTPIQLKAIPIGLQGTDLLACAQTGTGKTAAFAIPILQLLSQSPHNLKKRSIRSLIITPTRELAIQINESFKSYGRHLPLRSTVIFGGVNQGQQTEALRNGVDILIATPGRLIDLMNQGHLTLQHVEILVLDEADRMLDMGFINDVKKIIASVPKKRQTLFFSATMPDEIVKLSSNILHKPIKIEVTPVSSTADTIQQFIYFVDKGNKNKLLIEILKNKDIKTVLVFTRTKHGADKVVKVLHTNNIKAEAIHGNKAQNARQPNISETYVHRIGRTGRAGAKGTAYSFCDAEEKPFLKDIEKLISKKLPVIENHPFPLLIHNPVKAAPVQRPPRKKVDEQGKPIDRRLNRQKRDKRRYGNSIVANK